ncbi:hypothetical protein [Streptomyces sp. NPDC019224]
MKRAVKEHHDECNKMLYEGGTCTCGLIKRLGLHSERENFYCDNL